MFVVQSSLTYTHITLHIYYVTLYQNIHTFTYINILFNIHTICKYTLQYIKELQHNIVFNIRKKVPNHRMCYTVLIGNLHYYLNSLNI